MIAAIHNENSIELYSELGRKLGRLLYEGRWYDPQAVMIKKALAEGIAKYVTGTVTLELRRGEDYSILNTQGKDAENSNFSYRPERLTMEKDDVNQEFSPEDRIGQLHLRRLDIQDSVAKLS